MKKDFRTAYLNTLGFKGGQLKSSLEAIFEQRVIDLSKLKKICNIFEIPSQYRNRVWKILLGVTTSHQETWDFIQEQRTIEYEDLKHAVNLVRRGNLPESFYHQWKEITKQYSMDSDEKIVLEAKEIAANALAIIYHTKEQYFNFQNGLYYDTSTSSLNASPTLSSTSDIRSRSNHHQASILLSPSGGSSVPSSSSIYSSVTISSNDNHAVMFDQTYKNMPSQLNSLIPTFNNSNNNNNNNNNTQNNTVNIQIQQQQQQQESGVGIVGGSGNNKKDDDGSENSDDRKLEELVDEYTTNASSTTTSSDGATSSFTPQYEDSLKLVAEVFCYVCDNEVDAFWCFNNFLNKASKQYGHKDIGIYHQINLLSRLLELYDRSLWNHFHQHNVHVDQFSAKWFKTYFTCCFPTLCLDRLWDRIIGVSLDYMAFFGLVILQSKKSIIMEKQSTNDILNYLLNIKDLNVDIVLEKSAEYFTNNEP